MWKKADDCGSIREVIAKRFLGNKDSISDEELESALNPKSVLPQDIENLEAAANRILEAIDKGEQIAIAGDYDADGVTSTAILSILLTKLKGTYNVFLPRRMSEGYSLTSRAVDSLDSGLLITVDCGITAKEGIQNAKDKGLDVLVLDHHLPEESGELPAADIIVDPWVHPEKNAFTGYCGAGLALKVAEVIIDKRMTDVAAKSMTNILTSIACIGTIADVVPLVGDNRRIVKQGIENLMQLRTCNGLRVLMEDLEMTKYLTAQNIAFRVAPLLNAPGRMFDDGAVISYNLLVSQNINEAKELVKKIREINERRKEVVTASVRNAEKVIVDGMMYTDNPLVIYDESIPEGVVGIVAGRLAETYRVPTFVLTKGEDNVAKGSARSFGNVNIRDLLDSVSEHLLGYGGHASAAGVSLEIEKIDDFRISANSIVADMDYTASEEDKTYDLEIKAQDVAKAITELEKYEPYGEGNAPIIFKIEGVKLMPQYGSTYRLMGANDSTVKLFAGDFKVIWFNGAEEFAKNGHCRNMDVYGVISRNVWRYSEEVQVEAMEVYPIETKIEDTSLKAALLRISKLS